MQRYEQLLCTSRHSAKFDGRYNSGCRKCWIPGTCSGITQRSYPSGSSEAGEVDNRICLALNCISELEKTMRWWAQTYGQLRTKPSTAWIWRLVKLFLASQSTSSGKFEALHLIVANTEKDFLRWINPCRLDVTCRSCWHEPLSKNFTL